MMSRQYFSHANVLKYENGLCNICICVCTPETKEAEGSHEGMNYANIKEFDIADGPGVRVSLFVSGCRHHCKGCFNAMTWDFNYGEPFDDSIADRIIEALKPDFIQGFTLLGGEPFEPENQAVLAGLLKRIRSTYPKKISGAIQATPMMWIWFPAEKYTRRIPMKCSPAQTASWTANSWKR